ncbi:MAG: hypothetical protein WDW38_008754 [Sanguina aurantia]
MGGAPSVPAKGPEVNEPATTPPSTPAPAPAKLEPKAALTKTRIQARAASPVVVAAVESQQEKPSEAGPPSSSLQRPGSQSSSREVEQASSGMAWGASRKEESSAANTGNMVGRLASAAVMSIGHGELGSADSMVGAAPRLGMPERMGAVGEERHEGGSSFQSGAEGSGCGPDSRSSNPNNNVQTFVRTQSIDSMNLNNLNSIHEPAPATTSTNNGSGGSSSSANKSPSTPQAIPVSDPDAPPDPWASLQATYCMQHDRTSNDSPRRGQAIASGRHSSSSSSSSFGEGGMKSNRSKPSKMRDTGLIPVLSEDEDEDGPGVHRKHTPVGTAARDSAPRGLLPGADDSSVMDEDPTGPAQQQCSIPGLRSLRVYTDKAPRLPALGRAPPQGGLPPGASGPITRRPELLVTRDVATHQTFISRHHPGPTQDLPKGVARSAVFLVVRAGQWGEGDMATAGTLMLGEDVGKIRGSHQHSSQSGAASAAHSGWAHGAQHHERGSGGGGAGVQAGVRQREEGGDDDLDIRSLAPRTHRSNGSGEGDAMARSTAPEAARLVREVAQASQATPPSPAMTESTPSRRCKPSHTVPHAVGAMREQTVAVPVPAPADELPAPPPDMSLEEIDDFDTLLDEQAAAHSYSALDAKMAAFDAMHDGDYY